MTLATMTFLLGGIGLFLLGMWLMTEGLKLAAGSALRTILHSWTSTALRGLFAGFLITAVVRSSSAVTVATVGFVNAGLLTLTQAVWVVFGTNIGTTTTGWLVALIGVKYDVADFALPLIGIGMILRLVSATSARRAGIGQAIAGFGAFFLGIGALQNGFADLAPGIATLDLDPAAWWTLIGFVALGMALTVLTQSSSAAIAIALTASGGGGVPLELAAAAVVGTNIGTTSTAIFAAMGATSPAKRVATAHIAFNVLTGIVGLALLPFLLAASVHVTALVGMAGDSSTALAAFHTLFNCIGVAIIWPLTPRLVGVLSRFYVSVEEEIGRPAHLDATLAEVPALALRGLVLETVRMMGLAFDLARRRLDPVEGASRKPERLQAGLALLSQAIRDFIGRLGAAPLPDDVVSGLPDLVRTVQHLDDLAAIAAELVRDPPAPHAMQGESWDELRAAVDESLSLRISDGGSSEFPDAPVGLMERTENAYQRIKAELLDATARGRLPVAVMENTLLHAQRLRRCVDAAVKAQRRLLPWLRRLSGETRGKEPAPNAS